jgi:hypothetical protein
VPEDAGRIRSAKHHLVGGAVATRLETVLTLVLQPAAITLPFGAPVPYAHVGSPC